jgi:uncharacterized membrane protein YhaH (DUF805 family)
MQWLLWALMLFAQNASFTWTSRARNSSSVAYHAIAAVFSNGIYFVNLIFATDILVAALRAHDTGRLMAAAALYTACTVSGSVAMHHFLMKKVEKGKRKVGHG